MLIGDKWKVLILRDLMPGTKRFGELKKSIGSVSQKVLPPSCGIWKKRGLVSRKVYAEVPPRVEYSLTELGKSLKPILAAMCTWGEEYQAQNKERKNREMISCSLFSFVIAGCGCHSSFALNCTAAALPAISGSSFWRISPIRVGIRLFISKVYYFFNFFIKY